MPNRAARAPETSLYDVVKSFLEEQGFEAKGEVCGCDIVAVRPGEPPVLVITELKMALSLELVLQGGDRQRNADAVWLAVLATPRPRPGSPGTPPVPAAGLWFAGGAPCAGQCRDPG